MLKNYITLAVCNIAKDRLFAFINLAGLAALFVAWATTAGHAFRVARSSPINSLRHE